MKSCCAGSILFFAPDFQFCCMNVRIAPMELNFTIRKANETFSKGVE